MPTVFPMKTYQVDAAPLQESTTQFETVSRSVVNQSFDLCSWSTGSHSWNANGVEQRFDYFRFMRRCRRNRQTDWRPPAFHSQHDLCSFSAFCFTYFRPPFLAGTNILSAKTSSHFNRLFCQGFLVLSTARLHYWAPIVVSRREWRWQMAS